jgi:SAM-dependent methyltransferase
VAARQGDRVESGLLGCSGCGATYPIVGFIPRFVPAENYASSFGLEWRRHARTQYDSHTGLPITERRFFEETRWPRDLRGETVLEVGSGSGRFTEQAAATGAFVVSMDYSQAVEANYASNGRLENVLIVQASIYEMPFPLAVFDRLFCLGVLQHTPNVERAFHALPPMLKPGGWLAVDVYRRTWKNVASPKHYVRRLTRSMDPERLYRLTCRWVDLLWPVCGRIRRIPCVGPSINWFLLVADYSRLGLNGQTLKEWAYLDTFDMLSPRYDSPQTPAAVRHWFAEAGLDQVEVCLGYNGIEGRGRRPVATTTTPTEVHRGA